MLPFFQLAGIYNVLNKKLQASFAAYRTNCRARGEELVSTLKGDARFFELNLSDARQVITHGLSCQSSAPKWRNSGWSALSSSGLLLSRHSDVALRAAPKAGDVVFIGMALCHRKKPKEFTSATEMQAAQPTTLVREKCHQSETRRKYGGKDDFRGSYGCGEACE